MAANRLQKFKTCAFMQYLHLLAAFNSLLEVNKLDCTVHNKQSNEIGRYSNIILQWQLKHIYSVTVARTSDASISETTKEL